MMKRNRNRGIGMHVSVFPALAAGEFPPAVYAGMADVQEFTNKDEWIAAIGGEDAFTTIDFTGFPEQTFITDQYADLGVIFVEGDDNIDFGAGAYPNDGWGLDMNAAGVIDFETPHRWVAAEFPGRLTIDLYLDGELIYESGSFGHGGAGWFGGLISEIPFDRVILQDPAGLAFMDDFYFGGAIPAPPVISAFGLFGLALHRRRRRSL